MREYEIMFIVRPTLSEDEIKKVASNFQKTLAYDIKVGNNVYKSGYYFVINIESNDDKAVKEFDRLALISADIIRHIIINKED